VMGRTIDPFSPAGALWKWAPVIGPLRPFTVTRKLSPWSVSVATASPEAPVATAGTSCAPAILAVNCVCAWPVPTEVRSANSTTAACSNDFIALSPKYAPLSAEMIAEIATGVTQDEVIRGLKKEATLDGEDSSHSARVSAWAHLGKHLGMFSERLMLDMNMRQTQARAIDFSAMPQDKLESVIKLLESIQEDAAKARAIEGESRPVS